MAGEPSGERTSTGPAPDANGPATPERDTPGRDAPSTPTPPPPTPARTGVGIDGPTAHVARASERPAGDAGASSANGNGSTNGSTGTVAPGAPSTSGGAGRAPRGPAARRPGPGGPPGPPSGPFPAPPRRPGRGAPGRPAAGPLMPGTLLADRYRLVAEVGRDRSAEAAMWKARDVMLERDVAITLLVGTWQGDARASAALSRATRSAHFEHPHAARILDVVRPGGSPLPTGVLGAAVAEWTPGRDLVELVADGPLRPSTALRVIEPLADAVAAAHRSGLVLGLDHPQRVRVSTRAATRLAFPMPRGEATNADDVHGLGALLYLMLTARWPGPEGSQAPAGLRLAPHAPGGGPVPARQLRPDLPVELAALVDRTLDEDGGIRTAAAVHRLVTQMREGLEDDGVLLPVLENGQTIDADDPTEVWHDDAVPEPGPDPARRRKLRIGVTALVLATLAILGFVTYQVITVVAGGGSSGPPVVVIPETAAPAPAPVPAPASPSPAPVSPPPVAGGPVQLSSVAVYSPAGQPGQPDADQPRRRQRPVDDVVHLRVPPAAPGAQARDRHDEHVHRAGPGGVGDGALAQPGDAHRGPQRAHRRRPARPDPAPRRRARWTATSWSSRCRPRRPPATC